MSIQYQDNSFAVYDENGNLILNYIEKKDDYEKRTGIILSEETDINEPFPGTEEKK